MKVETTVEIDKPPSEVYEFLMDEENLTLWVKNFLKLERLEGEDGKVGSTSKHIYNENSRVVTFIEEIIAVEENKLLQTMLRNQSMEIEIINKLKLIAGQNTQLVTTSILNAKSILSSIKMFFSKKSIIKRQEEDIQRLKKAIEELAEDFD